MQNTEIPVIVLVVDDDLFTAQLTGFFLETAGYNVVLGEGGVDALEKMAGDPAIAIVVSDMNMPFLSGVELFTELRRQGDMRPFILLTGEDIAPLLLAHPGIDAVIKKDEHLEDTLPELVRSLLDNLHTRAQP